MAIGLAADDLITVQYKGKAERLTGAKEINICKKISLLRGCRPLLSA